jgi:hypothetical protein
VVFADFFSSNFLNYPNVADKTASYVHFSGGNEVNVTMVNITLTVEAI